MIPTLKILLDLSKLAVGVPVAMKRLSFEGKFVTLKNLLSFVVAEFS